MAAQADAVCCLCGLLTKFDDLPVVRAFYVQAGGAVTLFAFHLFLEMRRPAEVLGDLGMTRPARLGAYFLCARNPPVFGEGFLSLRADRC